MRVRRPPSFALLLLVVGVLLVRGLDVRPAVADEGVRVQVSSVDTADYPQARIILTAQDAAGRPLSALSLESFSVLAARKAVPISSLQTLTDAKIGISYLLVIDTSGSMEGQAIAAARQAAALFIDSLSPVDRVGVMAFADSVVVVSPFTDGFAVARGGLDGLVARGNTALYRAVSDAAASVRAAPTERRVVLLLSDGADYGGVSRATREEALAAASGAGASFYVIGLGPSVDEKFLQDLAGATRGRYFRAPDSAQLRAVYAEIAQLLRSQYVLTLDLSRSGLGGDTEASLVVTAGGLRGEAKLLLHLPLATPPQPVLLPQTESAGVPAIVWRLLLLGVLVVGVAAYVGRRVVNRSRRYVPRPPVDSPFTGQDMAPGARRSGEVLAQLVLSNGQKFQFDQRSVLTVGTDLKCNIVVPVDLGEFGSESLRIWAAKSRFLIHDASARPRLRLNGRVTSWAYLEHGDDLEVCGFRMRFQVLAGPSSVTPPIALAESSALE